MVSYSKWNDKVLKFIEEQEGDEVEMWDGVRELMDEWKVEGKMEGETKGIMNVARNLLKAKKFDDEDIISATGLTMGQLNQLKRE